MSNRTLPSPEAYPPAFHNAVREGGAVLYAADLPWTPISAAKKFRAFLRLVRADIYHPLNAQAKRRWSVQPTPAALVISIAGTAKTPNSPSGLLIDAAFARGSDRR